MNPHLHQFIQKLPKESVTMIRGNSLVLRNGDTHYPFRQDSNFLYLTGLSVPGLILTIRKASENPQSLSQQLLPEGTSTESILWREPITEHDITWGSDKLSDNEMRKISGIKDIRDIGKLQEYYACHREEGNYPGQQKGIPHNDWIASYPKGTSNASQNDAARNDRTTETSKTEPWQSILMGMRMVKAPHEIAKIQNCIRITESIYQEILEQVQPGMYEYEIESIIAYGFRRYHGTEAFPTIVASGVNSCTLHYTKNNRKIEPGDIVLIDFGIELDGYGADISRTFMVSRSSFGKELSEGGEDGGFPSFLLSHEEKMQYTRQREIYNAVKDVKRFAENTLKPGITRRAWNLGVKEYMYEMCKKLNLRDIEKYSPLTNPYYPHSIGHFLGLDTHDVGDSDTPLKPGMILTIEPGIYIVEESIGIRIEDDYLVTESGCVKLS